MANIDNLCAVYDHFSNSYSKVEGLMSELYGMMQNDQSVDTAQLLLHLGMIGESMLSAQRDFVMVYGSEDKALQEGMLTDLHSKSAALAQGNESVMRTQAEVDSPVRASFK